MTPVTPATLVSSITFSSMPSPATTVGSLTNI